MSAAPGGAGDGHGAPTGGAPGDAMPSWLLSTRAAIAALVGGGRLDAVPLESWLEAAAGRGAAADESLLGPLADRAVAGLAAQLRHVTVALPPTADAVVQLALLGDALDVGRRPGSRVRDDVHRTLLRDDGDPFRHAACLLDPADTRRWRALTSRTVADRAQALAERLVVRCALTDGPLVDELNNALQGQLTRLAMAALRGGDAPHDARTRVHEALGAARALGVRALAASGTLESSWEWQRSGFLDHDELIGDLFVPAWIVETAARAGVPAPTSADVLLASRPDGDPRYYRQAPALPRDADDAAAIVLATAGAEGLASAPLRVAARDVLRGAVDERGAVHTWELDGGDDGPSRWLGSHCPGVAARALRAIAADRSILGDAGVVRAARWLAGRADPDGGYRGIHYPSRVATTAMVLSALVAAGVREASVDHAIDRSVRWLRDRQDPDGSFSPHAQDTALAVCALADGGALAPAAAADAGAALASAQRWDGLWPAAPTYLCPHPGGRTEPFGCPPLATALALAALAAIGDTLRG